MPQLLLLIGPDCISLGSESLAASLPNCEPGRPPCICTSTPPASQSGSSAATGSRSALASAASARSPRRARDGQRLNRDFTRHRARPAISPPRWSPPVLGQIWRVFDAHECPKGKLGGLTSASDLGLARRLHKGACGFVHVHAPGSEASGIFVARSSVAHAMLSPSFLPLQTCPGFLSLLQ